MHTHHEQASDLRAGALINLFGDVVEVTSVLRATTADRTILALRTLGERDVYSIYVRTHDYLTVVDRSPGEGW